MTPPRCTACGVTGTPTSDRDLCPRCETREREHRELQRDLAGWLETWRTAQGLTRREALEVLETLTMFDDEDGRLERAMQGEDVFR